MKKMSVLVSISLLAVLLCGFCWPHNWIPATCTEPEICSKCGKTQADAFLIVDTQNDILLLCGLVRPHRLILHRHLVKQHVKKQRKVDRPNERGHKSRSLFRRTGLHSALIAWLLPAF